ncbi:MAG: cyclic nucleotide-binding domain-containing protein [Chloroflexi bacterium]|nr:cyclic nucleotide-binding domain-containing protein [Chloroflexota bacterium]
MVPAKVLRGFEIFQGLSDEQIKEIAALAKEEEFEEGAVIFQEDTEAENLYILEEGRVALRFRLIVRPLSKETTVDTVRRGEAFGWSALVKPHRLTASAICAERAKAVVIRGKELRELFEKNHHVGYIVMTNIAEIIATRLRDVRLQLIREMGQSILYGW